MKEINHEYTQEVVCPHCGYEYRDSWEFEDAAETACPECEKSFLINRIIMCEYVTKKLP